MERIPYLSGINPVLGRNQDSVHWTGHLMYGIRIVENAIPLEPLQRSSPVHRCILRTIAPRFAMQKGRYSGPFCFQTSLTCSLA